MKFFQSICSILFTVVFLGGCVSATYVKPRYRDIHDRAQYNISLNKDYDEVWQKLIKYSASTFFAIDNFEKDSGLITLSFGASNPSKFITGGYWKISGINNFEGDYVDFLRKYHGGRLSGRMNIVVTKIDNNITNLTVNARYVFTTPPTQKSQADTWAFDTGTCATKRVSRPTIGTRPERTICPTYKAENAIINAIK